MCGHEVVRQSVETGGIDPHRAPAVADDPRETQRQIGLPLRQRAHPFARLVVGVDARAPEVTQGVVEQSPDDGVVETVAVDGREHTERVAVETEVGAHPLAALVEILGEVAHRSGRGGRW